MPISINLLAEAHATEEMRRKDPVKRALLAAIVIVAVFLVWSSMLQLNLIRSKAELGHLESSWKNIEKKYTVAVDLHRKAKEAEEKITALQQMSTNRFLWGNVLNAFQMTLGGVENIQVSRLRADQTYIISEEAHKPNEKPTHGPTSTERITLLIDAQDYSPQIGGQVNHYKANIATEPFFQSNLNKTNGVLLLSQSPPLVDGRRGSYVKFSLQCSFTEKVR
ncbi:MAG TPA: hypothetical protein VGE41_09265 [Verrucomicrobiae bacterium]|jgi:hypothetical protein